MLHVGTLNSYISTIFKPVIDYLSTMFYWIDIILEHCGFYYYYMLYYIFQPKSPSQETHTLQDAGHLT